MGVLRGEPDNTRGGRRDPLGLTDIERESGRAVRKAYCDEGDGPTVMTFTRNKTLLARRVWSVECSLCGEKWDTDTVWGER